MIHRIYSVGRPSGWGKEAGDEYCERISRFAKVECHFFKEGAMAEKEMLEKSQGWWSICLDPSGVGLSTEDWKKEWEKLERGGRTGLTWMIGGADGFSDNFRKSCESVRSLGPQTLSHDLARVVLLEQVYRLESWRAGHPYHRK